MILLGHKRYPYTYYYESVDLFHVDASKSLLRSHVKAVSSRTWTYHISIVQSMYRLF